jgi:hypothetical protein
MYYDLFLHETNWVIEFSNFDVFIKANYDKYFKAERLAHMLHGDKRFPNIKITNDIFSTFLYFKTKSDSELHFIIDGTLNAIDNTLHFKNIKISLDYELNETEYEAILAKLRELSLICEGDALLYVNSEPHKMTNGKTYNSKELIIEIYEALDIEGKEKHRRIFQFLTKK